MPIFPARFTGNITWHFGNRDSRGHVSGMGGDGRLLLGMSGVQHIKNLKYRKFTYYDTQIKLNFKKRISQ